MGTDLQATACTERHLPYEITQCYLPPGTGERAQPNPAKLKVLDLPTPEL